MTHRATLCLDAQRVVNAVSPRPGAARRYAPAADGSSTVAYRFAANQAICISPWIQKIAADLRPSTDGSTVRTSLVAGGG